MTKNGHKNASSDEHVINDWWDDRYVRRRDRKSKRTQNKTKRKALKQCSRDSKRPMCKRRR